ncbi:MAG: hypothetical protein NTW29_04195 [Bacteroidetes bacterium]|nr:hypothetical protein [Bacteroidota bacterium]
MKKLLLLLLIAVAQQIAAQNTDNTIQANGIGPYKLGMKKAAIEKIWGKKIQLKNLLTEEGWQDTITVKYKNTDLQLYLQKSYADSAQFDIVLDGIKVFSPLFKTKAGVGVGDDKLKVINAYEFNSVSIWPEFEDDEFTRRSKTRAIMYVYFDKEGSSFVFHLLNKKVTAIEIGYAEEGD